MNSYSSFNEIEKSLKKLRLEKEIAKEELKIVGYQFDAFLKPVYWLHTALKFARKYGVFLIIKKVFK